jgi:hypothetical protein
MTDEKRQRLDLIRAAIREFNDEVSQWKQAQKPSVTPQPEAQKTEIEPMAGCDC